MTYSLSNSLSSISSSMQTIGNHISDRLKPKNLLKVGCVVAPIFAALQMASNVPGADAGLICFTGCMAVCLGTATGTGGAFVPFCTATCLKWCANPITP
ncbi:MAG: hypothetical protein ACRCU0_05620 [Candidatus Rhabdochlamydia sp.]